MRERICKRTALVLAVVLAAALAASAAFAQEPIGTISLLAGEVSLSRTGRGPVEVSLNEQVYLADVIETGPAAKVRVTFTDGSIVSLAEKSRMRLDEYVYSPEEGTRSVLSSLFFGTVKCLVSRLSGLTRNRFEVSTPTAVIGTRGTIFIVVYDEETGITQVYCLEDAVRVENLNVPGVWITVTESLGTAFGPAEVPPTPQPITGPQLQQLQQLLRDLAAGGGKRKGGLPPGGSPAGGLESPGISEGQTPPTGSDPTGGPSPTSTGAPPLPPYVTIEQLGPLPGPPPPP